ncbi:hypothetical protein [Kaistia sp. MMO-174]|uniref:hypothetical protein n=1 Tax=Kaistia sp. MMO-174 TaxID=3081256 RepID=UPI0030198268
MPQMRVLDDETLEDLDDRRGIAPVYGMDPDIWVPKLVERRLVGAARLINSIAGPVGPKGYGSGMPRYVHSEAEAFAAQIQMDEETRELDAVARNRGRIRATSRDISLMEAALRWPVRYLAEAAEVRGVLAVYLRCKAYRTPFDGACKKRGWSRATAYRDRDRALALIAQALNKDGVEVEV